MAGLYTDTFTRNDLRISQLTGSPGTKGIAALDQLLLVLPKRVPADLWRKIPQGRKLKTLLGRRVKDRVPAASGQLDNKRQTSVHLASFDTQASAFERLSFARRLVGVLSGQKPGSVGIWVLGFDAGDSEQLNKDLVTALLAASFPMPSFKASAPKAAVRSLKLIGLEEELDLARTLAEAESNNLARWLTALPPNKLDAYEYVKTLKELSREHGWGYEKLGIGKLQKKGAGAFLAVAQGNDDDSACIVRLSYRPAKKTARPKLTLVGKGIVFDTGGINLKPFNSMLDMHIDMGGSAVAVATLQAISALALDVPVDAWLAITENRIGPKAYKSQDVVTAANGKTIQTIHTDAEGRMALADTLVLASADKPAIMIDYATLTGACMTATTTRYSGVFTNNPDLHPVLRKAGRDSGERVWPFPIGGEFLEELKSTTADIQQCSPNGGGDHILAATFLNEFVDDDIDWIHVDLSAAMRKGGLGHIPTDITGFGVRFTLHLLLEKGLLGEA